MKKSIIYSPRYNATPDEIMQVIQVIVAAMRPPNPWLQDTGRNLMLEEYEKLSENAKRHFKIVEEP